MKKSLEVRAWRFCFGGEKLSKKVEEGKSGGQVYIALGLAVTIRQRADRV